MKIILKTFNGDLIDKELPGLEKFFKLILFKDMIFEFEYVDQLSNLAPIYYYKQHSHLFIP